MLVDLQKVPEEGCAIDCAIPPANVGKGGDDFTIDDTVTLSARLEPAPGRSFRLIGSVSAPVRVFCVRCLESYEAPLREEIDVTYIPEASYVSEGEDDRGLDDNELAVSFYRDEEIDLAHLAWEQIVLSLPMKPVCREACAGLCPSCGVNRNREQCKCVSDTADPRWQALRTLLEPKRAQD